MIQKLKGLEKAIVFLRWATDADFGRIKYVGEDFLEFEVLDPDTMEFKESFLINAQLILEVMISGLELSRLVAEVSANLPSGSEIEFD
ncbi:MAG: hypothetical protein E7Z91_01875 [Cyanobacteria bacterium SIG30]|nr:hypothetical protein [Cyanobacteria bacterium SIG30]